MCTLACRFDALAISLSGPSDLKSYSQSNTDEVGKEVVVPSSVSVISDTKNVCNDDIIEVCPGDDISDDGDDPSEGKGDYAHSGEDDAKKDSDDRVGDDEVHANDYKGHVNGDKCGGSEESNDEESEACDVEIDLNDGKGFNDEEYDAVKESDVKEDEADDIEVDTDDDNGNVNDSKCDSSKNSYCEDSGNEVHANDDKGNAIKESDGVNEAHDDEIDISNGKGSVIGDNVEEEADGDDANEDKGNVEGSDESEASTDQVQAILRRCGHVEISPHNNIERNNSAELPDVTVKYFDNIV